MPGLSWAAGTDPPQERVQLRFEGSEVGGRRRGLEMNDNVLGRELTAGWVTSHDLASPSFEAVSEHRIADLAAGRDAESKGRLAVGVAE